MPHAVHVGVRWRQRTDFVFCARDVCKGWLKNRLARAWRRFTVGYPEINNLWIIGRRLMEKECLEGGKRGSLPR